MTVNRAEVRRAKIAQLSVLMRERFGREMEFLSMRPLGTISDSLDVEIAYRDIQNLGCFRVRPMRGLTPQEIQEISDFLNLVMGPILYLEYLDRKNDQITSQTGYGGIMGFENIHDITHSDFEFDVSEKVKIPLAHQIHFTSSSSELSLKAALSIHDSLKYHSFLHFESLRGSVDSAQQLFEMNRVTIYVGDLSSLRQEEFNLVVDFAELTRGLSLSHIPLVITTMQKTRWDLLATTGFNPDALEIVLHYNVDLSRLPQRPHLFRDALELLLVKSPSS